MIVMDFCMHLNQSGDSFLSHDHRHEDYHSYNSEFCGQIKALNRHTVSLRLAFDKSDANLIKFSKSD